MTNIDDLDLDVRLLDLKPTDKVIIRLNQRNIEGVALDMILTAAKAAFPDNPVVVLEEGSDIEIVAAA